MNIPVKTLSPEPDIGDGTALCDLQGSYAIRVAARNIAGLGKSSELGVVLEGEPDFLVEF